MVENADNIASRLGITEQTKVLDVGGSANPFPYGDVTIADLLEPPQTFRGAFCKVDLCNQPLPFQDNEFEVSICSHTFEDLYYPFLSLSEINRVSRKGYIETPHRGLESAFIVSVDQGVYPGWGHHQWLFDVTPEGQLLVIQKAWYFLRYDATKVGIWKGPKNMQFYWEDNFSVVMRTLLNEHGDHWDLFVQEHNRWVQENSDNIIIS